MGFVPKIEICVEGIDEAVLAAEAGADRVELCTALSEGGLTASPGLLREAAARVKDAKVMAIVRPRKGDFLYTDAEYAVMLGDVAAIRDAGLPGMVCGCLNADGTIDAPRMAELVRAAGPMEVTCHRAFDMAPDPYKALDALIRCGVTRVLTSGQTADARNGLDLLRGLIRHAAGRIEILVCGQLSPSEIDPNDEGLTGYEFHFADATVEPGPMDYRNPDVFMGTDAGDAEYERRVIDPARLAAKIRQSRGL